MGKESENISGELKSETNIYDVLIALINLKRTVHFNVTKDNILSATMLQDQINIIIKDLLE